MAKELQNLLGLDLDPPREHCSRFPTSKKILREEWKWHQIFIYHCKCQTGSGVSVLIAFLLNNRDTTHTTFTGCIMALSDTEHEHTSIHLWDTLRGYNHRLFWNFLRHYIISQCAVKWLILRVSLLHSPPSATSPLGHSTLHFLSPLWLWLLSQSPQLSLFLSASHDTNQFTKYFDIMLSRKWSIRHFDVLDAFPFPLLSNPTELKILHQ